MLRTLLSAARVGRHGGLLSSPSSWGLPAACTLATQLLQHSQHLIKLRLFSFEAKPLSDLLVVHPKKLPEYQLHEALRLAESYVGAQCPHVVVGPAQRFKSIPATYFGNGLVHSIYHQTISHQAKRVYVNATLTGVQQRNLEAAWGVPVLDRVGLIIEIFGQRARTREARLQVELASLEYKASRLVRVTDPNTGKKRGFGLNAETEVVSARERGRSGSGSGGLGAGAGGGESEIELQRRRVGERRKMLMKRLEEVRRTRAVQRAARRRSNKPTIAVVGYTNAGKSSLVGALTKSDVGVEDRLFATLDPTLRRVMLPSGHEAILSDTVGFISDLPHQLVDAFHATLEEVTEADLLLHVLDASSSQVLEQREAVLQVLRELGFGERQLESQVVEVWNKADLLAGDIRGDSPGGSPGSSSGKAAAGEQQGQGQGRSHEQEGGLEEGQLAEAKEGEGVGAGDQQQREQQQQQQQLTHLGFIRQLLDSHAAAAAAGTAGAVGGRQPDSGRARGRRGSGVASGVPAPPVLTPQEAAELLRTAVLPEDNNQGKEARRGDIGGQRLPIAVLTSAAEGAGLPELLQEVERKLLEIPEIQAIWEFSPKRWGARLPPAASPPSFQSQATAAKGVGGSRGRGSGASKGQHALWSDEVLAQRLV